MVFMGESIWNGVRLARLKQLFDDGHSHSRIAQILNEEAVESGDAVTVTRNAVLAKCHRSGWTRLVEKPAVPKHKRDRMAEGGEDVDLRRGGSLHLGVRRAAVARSRKPRGVGTGSETMRQAQRIRSLSDRMNGTDGEIAQALPAPLSNERAIALRKVDDRVPPDKRVRLLDLKWPEVDQRTGVLKHPGHCRWPIGDPRDPETFGFCGLPMKVIDTRTAPYCKGHRPFAISASRSDR